VVLASLANVGKTLSQAIQIPTSVTPAADPVKLDNAPKNTTGVAADLHYHAGYFFETQEKPIEAASHYREALQKSPQDARALAGYGRALARLGNTVEAEDYLKRASSQAPQDPAPHHDLAQFYSQQKNFETAIRCEQRAVELQSTNPQYRIALASLLLDSGNHADAAHVLSAVFGDAMACFHVGCMLNDRQQPQLARQYLQQSLALNPGLAPAREKLDRWGFAAIPPQSGPGIPAGPAMPSAPGMPNTDWR
jgi:tetratricopeptide (TPR) repeat protein